MPSYELSAKLFVEPGHSVESHEYIPIFHRWIRDQVLPGQLLVDVSDYSHVPSGPGVILVAHGAIYGMDEEHGRLGLLHRRRREDASVELAAQLHRAVSRLFDAAVRLEADLSGKLRFRGNELEVTSFARLHAPNEPATSELFRPAFDALAARLWPGLEVARLLPRDVRERFGVRFVTSENVPTTTLRDRVGAPS